MGKTIAEKILSENSGSDAHAGDIIIARVGLAFLQDGTGPLALRQLKESGLEQIANPERASLITPLPALHGSLPMTTSPFASLPKRVGRRLVM
jgi:homoaconitase/3-isopropylmalate dehydratase large subunit